MLMAGSDVILRRISMLQRPTTPIGIGSLDGTGSADHDLPYRFGWRPNAQSPFPFSTRQFARLLVLRSRIDESFVASGDLADREAA
jgi:hypothetical protein